MASPTGYLRIGKALQGPVASLTRKCSCKRAFILSRSLSSTSKTGTTMTDRTRLLVEAISKPDHDITPELEIENRMRRRLSLSRAITLVESRSQVHMEQADLMLGSLLGGAEPVRTGDGSDESSTKSRASSFRLGIAGPPGVGKSTFIETFGLFVLDKIGNESVGVQGDNRVNQKESVHDSDSAPSVPRFAPSKVAVLCIDPSSTLSGGSILGDKTRMMELSRHDRAFVRPSPSRGTLGGVSAYTDDVVSLCQAAGYNLVIVETVGLGQSEVEITEGVDMLILIVSPGGGDELQAVKKGIVEVADMILVGKSDGDLLPAARQTAADYKGAMHFLRQRVQGWETNVVMMSAKTGFGMDAIWTEICRFRNVTTLNGQLAAKRRRQASYWMWKHVRDMIVAQTKSDPILRHKAETLEHELDLGLIPARVAASELLKSFSTERHEGS